MNDINADVNKLLQISRNMQYSITSLITTKNSINMKYQQLGADWNDKRYKELGGIVQECNKALNDVLQLMVRGEKYVTSLAKSLREYEDVNLDGSSSNGFTRHLNTNEVNSRWRSSVESINEQIENYREALHARGVPDCKWLNDTLARHRAAMLEQQRYELGVASGHANDSAHSAESYHYPENYTVFYNQLADEFRQYSLNETNPHYNDAPQWRNNCQRCVPTLEMRRRGSEVTARPSTYGSEHLSYHPFDVWQNASVIYTRGSGLEQIQNIMSFWGDGARAQVVVYWDSPHGGGHTFIAEQRNGETVFSDPQTGRMDVSAYFNRVRPNTTQFCRIDNLQFSNYIEECYQEVQA